MMLIQVAYFTAIFPYIVLLVLVIQSSLLDGAIEGIKFYVIPRWELVAKFEVEVFFKFENIYGNKNEKFFK